MYIDFTGFSEYTLTHKAHDTKLIFFNFFFSLFYFIIIYINLVHLILIKFFFSKNYINTSVADIHITSNGSTLKIYSTMYVLLIHKSCIVGRLSIKLQMYAFLSTINVNAIIVYNLLILFMTFKTFNFNFIKVYYFLLILKACKTLYTLNIVYSINVYRTYFNDITHIYLLQYIIFLINFFTIFIKDFIYITVTIGFLNAYFLFSFIYINFNIIKNLYNKKQLCYINN